MKKKFKVQYVSRDEYKARCNSDCLIIEDFGEIEVDANNEDYTRIAFEEAYNTLNTKKDWKFMTWYSDPDDLIDYLGDCHNRRDRLLKECIQKFNKRLFIQTLDQSDLFSNYIDGCFVKGFVRSTGWALVNIQEIPPSETEILRYEINGLKEDISNLKKEIDKLKKEIKYIKKQNQMVGSSNG